MTRALTLLCGLLAAAPLGASDDLLFSDGAKTVCVRIEVTDGDTSPEVAWASFLDALFVYFDRDGNGMLSEAEAKRVFPLPLFNGKEVGPDFAAQDADRDGKVSKDEFRAFYRLRDFTSVAVVLRPPSVETHALNDALFRHLDRDGNGELSAAELRAAPDLLKRLDDDEDEALTAKELLGTAARAPIAAPAGVKLVPVEKDRPDATLRLAPGGKPALGNAGPAFRLSADGARLQLPDGVCAVTATRDDPAAGLRAAKAFYLAQFKSAAGGKPATKALFEDDPTAQVLTGLFDAADRDGDGKLTLAELEAFFDLVDRGVGCRVVVAVTDRGRNLFDVFDANGDGRLDIGELLKASKALPDELARDKPLTRGAIPAAYRLAVNRGPAGDAFGPVPFGAVVEPKPPVVVAQGPAWFKALDKNGDGFVSAQEFVGPPELFAKLDADGDGRIGLNEAERARP